MTPLSLAHTREDCAVHSLDEHLEHVAPRAAIHAASFGGSEQAEGVCTVFSGHVDPQRASEARKSLGVVTASLLVLDQPYKAEELFSSDHSLPSRASRRP